MKLKGVLMISDGEAFIREYLDNGEFNDIGIVHQDLDIEIDDDSAVIRKDADGGMYIDYTDAILGR